jgi:hypothetical protein
MNKVMVQSCCKNLDQNPKRFWLKPKRIYQRGREVNSRLRKMMHRRREECVRKLRQRNYGNTEVCGETWLIQESHNVEMSKDEDKRNGMVAS